MKLKGVIIILIGLIFSKSVFTQAIYQEFKSDGFKVKCECILVANTEFINAVKEQQEINNFLSAYQCVLNGNNPENRTVFSINIFNETDFLNQFASQAEVIPFIAEKTFLHRFVEELSETGVHFENTTFKDVPAVEYKQAIDGIPLRSIVFLLNKKSFHIEVASKNSLDARFTDFVNSFEIF